MDMILVAIAKIRDNSSSRNVLGLRLYDVISKSYRDVQMEQVRDIVVRQGYNIRNLKIEDGKILDGLNHIPFVDEVGDLKREYRLNIVGRLFDTYYCVKTNGELITASDRALFKDVETGIVNGARIIDGKIVNKIGGIIRFEDIIKRGLSCINSNSHYGDCNKDNKYTAIQIGGKLDIFRRCVVQRYDVLSALVVDGIDKVVIEDDMLSAKSIIMSKAVEVRLSKNRKADVDYLVELAKRDILREFDNPLIINNIPVSRVMNMGSYGNYGYTSHYNKCDVNNDIGISIIGGINGLPIVMDDNTARGLVDELLRERDSVFLTIFNMDNKCILKNSRANKRGIVYSLLDTRIYRETEIKIEDIYRDVKSFANAKIENNNILVIDGIDGTFIYDMDKILEKYKIKNSDASERRSKKASVIGKLYKEYITEKGELKDLVTDSEIVIVPKETKSIAKDAIKINKSTKKIIFIDGIEKCNADCILNQDRNSLGLLADNVDIEIKTKGKAVANILKSVANNIIRWKLIIDRNLEFEEFNAILDCSNNNKNIIDNCEMAKLEEYMKIYLENSIVKLSKPLEIKQKTDISGKTKFSSGSVKTVNVKLKRIEDLCYEIGFINISKEFTSWYKDFMKNAKKLIEFRKDEARKKISELRKNLD